MTNKGLIDLMHIEVYDMLVFEDENGSIYQDCVCRIYSVDVYNNFCNCIECNNFRIYLDKNNEIIYITSNESNNCNLKEIWSRVNEDTYKRVWKEN